MQSILKGLTSSTRSKPGPPPPPNPLKKRERRRRKLTPKKAYWIQISGASLLGAPEIASKTFGEPTSLVYNDLDRAANIRAHIRRYPARAVDNFVLDVAARTDDVRTALVPGGIIFGPGRGPVKGRSVQVPELSRVTLQRGKAVQVGRGLSVWGSVHVHDLSGLFLLLVEKAVAGDAGKYWNEEGIYFNSVENDIVSFSEMTFLRWECGAHFYLQSFAEISQRVAKAAVEKGYIQNVDVEQLAPEEADKLTPHASVILGTNARVEARRAREVLGWKPAQKSLEEEIPETLQAEAERLGVSSKI